MRTFLYCLLALLPLSIGCGGSDQPAINRTFDGYKTAIMAKDGAKACQLVDQNTLNYYGKMRDSALTASAEQVRGMPSIMDKMMVLVIRHRMEAGQLEAMSSTDLFSHAVEQGWVGSQVAKNEMGSIEVSGDSATAVHMMDGQETPVRWQFRKEDGNWKIDLTSIMSLGDQAMRRLFRQSRASEDDLLLFDLRHSVGANSE